MQQTCRPTGRRMRVCTHIIAIDCVHVNCNRIATDCAHFVRLSTLFVRTHTDDAVQRVLLLGNLLSILILTMMHVIRDAAEQGRTNVAFLANFLLCDVDACLALLCDTGRAPEAAFLARAYAPSKVSKVLDTSQRFDFISEF